MKQLVLWMSLNLCETHQADKEKWKYHSLLLSVFLEDKEISIHQDFSGLSLRSLNVG